MKKRILLSTVLVISFFVLVFYISNKIVSANEYRVNTYSTSCPYKNGNLINKSSKGLKVCPHGKTNLKECPYMKKGVREIKI